VRREQRSSRLRSGHLEHSTALSISDSSLASHTYIQQLSIAREIRACVSTSMMAISRSETGRRLGATPAATNNQQHTTKVLAIDI